VASSSPRCNGFLIGEGDFYDDIFQSFSMPYEPARWSRDRSPVDETHGWAEKALQVQQLINMYRVRGHLIADLDPLGRREPKTHAELDPIHWGLTIWDLEREFPTGGLAGRRTMQLRDILGVLRDAYARTVGLEYMHIQEVEQKAWIQDQVEGTQNEITPLERDGDLSRHSTRPRRSSGSCTPSTWARSGSASKAPRP